MGSTIMVATFGLIKIAINIKLGTVKILKKLGPVRNLFVIFKRMALASGKLPL